MMANIKMANMTNNPICIRGARAFRMDFKTTCKPMMGKGGNKIFIKSRIFKLEFFLYKKKDIYI